MQPFKSLLLLVFCIPSLQAEQPITVTSHPQQTALLELYTSEGCSSCPPAERWLNQVIKQDDPNLNVLALAFHVDYWDYIGWKDRFASPRHTARQRQLSKKNRMNTIYTPGFFINDMESRNTRNLLDSFQPENQPDSALTLELQVTHDPNQYTAQVKYLAGFKKTHKLQIIVFEDNLISEVTDGENTGRNLKHEHVVRYLSPTLTFDTDTNQAIRHVIPVAKDWKRNNQGLAALVKTSSGEYLQSVQLFLNNPGAVTN